MKTSIFPSPPRGDVREAGVAEIVEALYGRGDLRLALHFVQTAYGDAAPPLPIAELAARAAARCGDFESAIGYARTLRANGAAISAAFEGYALARIGFEPAGYRMLEQCLTSNDPAARSEARYRLTLLQWRSGALDDAERTIRFDVASDLPETPVQFHEMMGWIETRRTRYSAAGVHFRDALLALEHLPFRDEVRRQHLQEALTIIALNTLSLELVRGIEFCHLSDVGLEACESACYSLQHRAWIALACGDEVQALDLLQRAFSFAKTPSLVALVNSDLAKYHRLRGSDASALGHLLIAESYLCDQDWGAADADERMALLEYAMEAYYLNPQSAGAMLTRYLSRSRRRETLHTFERDARVAAIERIAKGVLEAIHGRRFSARKHLYEAVGLCRALGYRYWEAKAALLLHEQTGEEQHLDFARRAARSVPRSWIMQEVERRSRPEGTTAPKDQPRKARTKSPGQPPPGLVPPLGDPPLPPSA